MPVATVLGLIIAFAICVLGIASLLLRVVLKVVRR